MSMSVSEYCENFKLVFDYLKDKITSNSPTAFKELFGSLLYEYENGLEDADTDDIGEMLGHYGVGENYKATELNMMSSKVLLVLATSLASCYKLGAPNSAKARMSGKQFGYDVSGSIATLCKVVDKFNMTPTSVLHVFAEETGMSLRSISFSEYLEEDYYIEDILAITDLISAKSVTILPYKGQVSSHVESVLAVYDTIYASGFDVAKPVGILDDTGFYYRKGNRVIREDVRDERGDPIKSVEMMLISNLLRSRFGFKGTTFTKLDIESLTAMTDYNMISVLMLKISLGAVLSDTNTCEPHKEYQGYWEQYREKVIKPYLTDNVFGVIIADMLEKGLGYQAVINEFLTIADKLKRTCLVVEWDDVALKLRIFDEKNPVVSTYVDDLSVEDYLFKNLQQSCGELISNSRGSLYDVKLVKDVQAYNQEPIFAYQALDGLKASGSLPSWENVILGRLATDKTLTYDFSKYAHYHVVAASGSGKGVMCLNMLASALGSGYPVFYLDSKPDMAQTIKSIQPDAVVCTGEGCGGLNINESEFLASVPQYAKSLLGNSYDDFGGIVYLKLLQLAFLVSDLRKKVIMDNYPAFTKEELGYNSKKNQYERLIVFVDELEKATARLSTALGKSKEKYAPFLASKKETQKAMLNEEDMAEIISGAPESARLGLKLFKWEYNLSKEFLDTTKASARIANIHFIYIYQSYNMGDVARRSHRDEHVLATLKGFPQTAKIIGAGADYYPEAAMKIPQLSRSLTKEKRWFSLSIGVDGLDSQERTVKALDSGSLKVFKPYLILNSSKIDSVSVSTFLSGDEKRRDRFTLNGEMKDKRVGFEDYVTDMLLSGNNQETPASLLRVGTALATKVVNRLGYNTVNDYLYDFNIDSFMTIQEMLVKIANFDESEVVKFRPQSLEDFGDEDSETDVADAESVYNGDTDAEVEYEDAEEQSSAASFTNDKDYKKTKKAVFDTEQEFERINPSPLTASFFGKSFNYTNYEEPLAFELAINDTSDDASAESYNALCEKVMSDIEKMIGGYARITNLAILSNRVIVNGVSYSPSTTEKDVKNLPYDIKNNVLSGQFAWLFDFKKLRVMKNLTHLKFDSSDFVYMKVRKDLGVVFDFTPSYFFRIIKNLFYLEINGERITAKDPSAGNSMFHKASRSETFYNWCVDAGFSRTKKTWGSIVDVYSDTDRSALSKTWGLTWRTAVMATVGTATVAAKAGGLLAKAGKGVVNFVNILKENK